MTEIKLTDNFIKNIETVKNEIIVCPVCGKKTFLRIQKGDYLHEYPIRINCMNCRALLKGIYYSHHLVFNNELIMFNANVEECNPRPINVSGVFNSKDDVTVDADYIAEVSGEIPCNYVTIYKKGIPDSPSLNAADYIEDIINWRERLSRFSFDLIEWIRTKSVVFQLLDEGSDDYLPFALDNKLGNYEYKCDSHLKSFHCLQEIVLEQSKHLFVDQSQKDIIRDIIYELSKIDKEKLHDFCTELGGIEELISSYRKVISVFNNFIGIYSGVLPAETYSRFKNKTNAPSCIATCSFSDLKTFYQDSYEAIASILFFPVCLDNITVRGNFDKYDPTYNNTRHGAGVRSFEEYSLLDHGTRVNKLDTSEYYQKEIDFPADRILRNGIGHNNVEYDGITQTITAHDRTTCVTLSLMEMAIYCIKIAKSAVLLSEIILFLLREEHRRKGITTLVHPFLYDGLEPNMRCPCGSNKKYKRCCKRSFDSLQLSHPK